MTLFFSDIDGTLLDSTRRVNERTARAVAAVVAAGHPFVLASSRMPESMRLVESAWGAPGESAAAAGPLIAYNGGLVLDGSGAVVLDVPIAAPDARVVHEACARLGVHGSFYAGDSWFAWADDRFTEREVANTGVHPERMPAMEYVSSGLVDQRPPHKIMAMGEPAAIDAMAAVVDGLPGVVGYRSKPTYLEIANAACSKGSGVLAVAESLGVPASECVFFGDNHNDLPAFAVVGTAVAVANAQPPVLAAASVVTAMNHAHGVAQYLEGALRDR
ncbi:HAD hydrolase family protein [Herbiconiux moechotypicola]|uniref:Cof-type HAD-IIB family hydrolase n=1 Tax=Herbiconiux moechotypicola TaxID=637393 RepID=A0ABN3DCQ4_9MICO|nr:HAD hydrolase family protein [Herbiconiux moechotypicola]MCS5728703.1 HAD hydrolase family protein [Herbiconiux moechotypicola]